MISEKRLGTRKSWEQFTSWTTKRRKIETLGMAGSRIQGPYLNIRKAIYSKETANIKLKEPQSDSNDIGNKKRFPQSPYLLNIVLEDLVKI